MPLGDGFAIVAVVNTDQGYIGTEYQQALLYGRADLNRPTILSINGGSLHSPDGALPRVYVARRSTPASEVTIGGTGFNNAGVNFFTSVGKHGSTVPETRRHGYADEAGHSSQAPLGLGAFEVINNPYTGAWARRRCSCRSVIHRRSAGEPKRFNDHGDRHGLRNGAVVNFFNKQRNGSVVNSRRNGAERDRRGADPAALHGTEQRRTRPMLRAGGQFAVHHVHRDRRQ
jgi:hypothetical protein